MFTLVSVTEASSSARAVGKDIKGMVSPIIYAVGVALAFVSLYVAYVCYAVVAVIWFVPDRRLTNVA